MKRFSSALRFACVAALFLLVAPGLGFAADLNPPVVQKRIADFTVPAGTGQSAIKLKKTFALSGVTGPIVRFSTTKGNIDVELLTSATPNTVSQFLAYANNTAQNGNGVYSYTDTLIQRAVPGFIVQGGGFYVDSAGAINQILGRPSITSEASIKNTRGTLAMALSTGPDSATGDFFFNLADNAILDDKSDGGPFTVFGQVVNTLATLDTIAALPQRDFSSQLGASFANVPLVDFDGTQSASVDNLVYLNKITPIALVGKKPGDPTLLKVKVSGNSNPGLVTATLSGFKLVLTYTPDQTGSATISLKAKTPAGGKVKTSFTVTVQ